MEWIEWALRYIAWEENERPHDNGDVSQEDGNDRLAQEEGEKNVSVGDEEEEPDEFDGDFMERLLRASLSRDGNTVSADLFIKGVNQVPKLMSGLGRGFDFAIGDLVKKLRIAEQRLRETEQDLRVDRSQVTLQDMVERDIENGHTHLGKPANPASRIILRLLWLLDFASAMLRGVADKQDSSLREIVRDAYDSTLGPRHIRSLRLLSRAGIRLVPKKEIFIEKMHFQNVSVDDQIEKLHRWSDALDDISKLMWDYMKSRNLEVLP